jgi:hypothetical protein
MRGATRRLGWFAVLAFVLVSIGGGPAQADPIEGGRAL